MKQYYISFRTPLAVIFSLMLLYLPVLAEAQCNCPPGQEPNTLVHTQVISTSLEVTNLQFPKFDATLGTLSCATVNAAITSVVRIRLENDEAFDLTYRLKYERSSTISGPGLNPTLVHSFGKNYGPFNLAASDGEIFSGPDFVMTPYDTVLRDVVLTGVVSGNISEFLGTDSINYEYLITGRSIITGGGNYLGGPNTRDHINFQLIYTYCTPMLLSASMNDFTVEHVNGNAILNWTDNDDEDPSGYSVEMSTDNKNFIAVGTLDAASSAKGIPHYRFQYPLANVVTDKVYFRVAKTRKDGSVIRSGIKVLTLKALTGEALRVYPNPARNEFSMNFTTGLNGQYTVDLYNTAGYRVHRQQFAAGTHNRLVVSPGRPLPDGMYIVRAKDAQDRAVYSGRVFIKN